MEFFRGLQHDPKKGKEREKEKKKEQDVEGMERPRVPLSSELVPASTSTSSSSSSPSSSASPFFAGKVDGLTVKTRGHESREKSPNRYIALLIAQTRTH